jgi:hypothetical protein
MKFKKLSKSEKFDFKRFAWSGEISVDAFARNCSASSFAVTNHTISLCGTMFEAEKRLSKLRFDEFCRRLKLSKRSSIFKKFRIIGSNASRLYRYAYHLPVQLNALYECARLADDDLEALVKAGRIHISITDGELMKVIRSNKAPMVRTERRKKHSVVDRREVSPLSER